MIEILERGKQHVPEFTQNVLNNLEENYLKLKSNPHSISHKPNPFSNYLPIKITTEAAPESDKAILKVETNVGKGYYFFAIKNLLSNTIQHLLSHRWTLLHTHADITLPTSDDPVIKLNYFDENNYNFGGRWGSQGTELITPLSPNIIMYTKIGDKPPSKYSSFNLKQSQLIQKIIIEHAHRTLFCNEKLSIITQLRPRKVDLNIYTHEKESWLNWHNQNIEAEKSL